MLDAFALLGGLTIIEAIKGADEIAGDAANAMERDFLQMIGKIDELSIYTNVNAVEALAVQFSSTGYISSDFFIRQLAIQNGNLAIIYNHG